VGRGVREGVGRGVSSGGSMGEGAEEEEEGWGGCAFHINVKPYSSVDHTEILRKFLFPPFLSLVSLDHDVRRSAAAPMTHIEMESCPNT
jgi:hypothetical protein